MNQEEIVARFQAINKKGSANADSTKSGPPLFKTKDGHNLVRFLPAVDPTDTFFVQYYVHYKVGPNAKTVVCPRSIGKSCPICGVAKSLYEQKTEEATKQANAIVSKSRYRTNILDLNDLAKGIQIFEFGPDIYKQLISIMADDEISDVSNLTTGRAISITRSGKDMTTSYLLAPKVNTAPLDPSYIGQGHDLVTSVLSRLVDNDMIEKILLGEVEEKAGPLSKYVNTNVTTQVSSPIIAPVAVVQPQVIQPLVIPEPVPVTQPVAQPIQASAVIAPIADPTATSIVAPVQVAPAPVEVAPVATITPTVTTAPVAENAILAKIRALKNKNPQIAG
jgi:hypothetical protein